MKSVFKLDRKYYENCTDLCYILKNLFVLAPVLLIEDFKNMGLI